MLRQRMESASLHIKASASAMTLAPAAPLALRYLGCRSPAPPEAGAAALETAQLGGASMPLRPPPSERQPPAGHTLLDAARSAFGLGSGVQVQCRMGGARGMSVWSSAEWSSSVATRLQENVAKAAGRGAEEGRRKVLSFCGGGPFLWWQLGVAKLLRERYDLSRTHMLGASGGAIAATLTACGVSAEQAVQRAHALAVERGLMDRPLGVVGVWGRQVRDWLNDVLPHEAAELCRERVRVLVTDFPALRERKVGDFTCRADLTDAVMASAHIPWLMDYRFTTYFRGRLVFDGGMWDWLYQARGKAICEEGAIMIDHHADETLADTKLDVSRPLSFEAVMELVDRGYAHALKQDALGLYAHLDPIEQQLATGEAELAPQQPQEPHAGLEAAGGR